MKSSLLQARGAQAALGLLLCLTSFAWADTAQPCDPGTRASWMSAPVSACAFTHIGALFPLRRVGRSETGASGLSGTPTDINIRYEFRGKSYNLQDFASRTRAYGIIALQGDSVLAERYGDGTDAHTRFLSFSVSKSVVSTLIGMAIKEGLIGQLDDRIDKYLPDLAGSGYDGVTVRQLLSMGSGTQFSEVYENPRSGIGEFVRLVNKNEGQLYQFVRSLPREHAPGTRFNYASPDTEILGELLRRVSGMPLADYASKRLWVPLGMQEDAQWLLDGADGREVSSGGLAASLRDLARYGRFVADGGKTSDGLLVPDAWFPGAIRPGQPYTAFGKTLPNTDLGYGFQWWVRPLPRMTVAAMGIFGQFILIDQASGTVLVVLSAWTAPFEADRYEETFALFDSLVQANSAKKTSSAK